MAANLLLERIAFGEDGPRRGYAVVTACTYDGKQGIQVADTQMPPIKIVHKRKKPWRYNFHGDGLLVRHWEDVPSAFGYVIFVTVTNKMEAALDIAAATSSVVQAGASAVGVEAVGGIAGAVSGVLRAIKGISGARVIGTLVGSEVDAEGTEADWSFRRREGDVHYTLCFDVAGDDGIVMEPMDLDDGDDPEGDV